MTDQSAFEPEAEQEQAMPMRVARRRSAQWGDLMTALAKAQGEIEGAKKESKATITGSTMRTYADLASVWTAIREPLSKHGLALTQWPRVVDGGVEVETILAHGEQYVSDILWMPVGQMTAQGIGSAITYGRRYALMAIAGVAPEDDDGNAAVVGSRPDARPAFKQPSSASGRKMAAEESDLIDDTRQKGTVKKPAPLTAAEKAKAWVDGAIQTLNLSQHTVDSISIFQSDNADKIDWLKEHVPGQYDRFAIALDNASESARAKVSA